MLCDNCGKEPARVHYKELKDNSVTEYHLCEKCATEKGIQIPHKQQTFSISNILAGMADEVGSDMSRCRSCGLTYKEFRETGRLGCSACYDAFKEQLKLLLRRIHGSNVHTGKSPRLSQGAFEKKREIENLKAELGQAIDREDFETAAQIRDRIRDLEGKQENPD
jgi:protein arginine kinase activator